ncbi:LLM class flavin-dependent oxidoreductase [Micromonospora endophytica]|uniref:LLM class flavin-dependent oxidoreductase n=1 Tax=Micromonospora endophytica TaxID=515350 RepID=UPI003B8A924D
MFFGGTSAASIRRVATRGTGWLAGTASVKDLIEFVPRLSDAWTAHGRVDSPRVVTAAMFAIGPDAKEAVRRAIGPYYAFAGRNGHSTASTAHSPRPIRSPQPSPSLRRTAATNSSSPATTPIPARLICSLTPSAGDCRSEVSPFVPTHHPDPG